MKYTLRMKQKKICIPMHKMNPSKQYVKRNNVSSVFRLEISDMQFLEYPAGLARSHQVNTWRMHKERT